MEHSWKILSGQRSVEPYPGTPGARVGTVYSAKRMIECEIGAVLIMKSSESLNQDTTFIRVSLGFDRLMTRLLNILLLYNIYHSYQVYHSLLFGLYIY
jgi:hypothetical protein